MRQARVLAGAKPASQSSGAPNPRLERRASFHPGEPLWLSTIIETNFRKNGPAYFIVG
jgi:hypothetical protein